MLRITVQELETQGIEYQKKARLHLFGKDFVHEQSYAKSDSALAMEYCRNELGQNRVCVLVVEPTQDSVWREASEAEALMQQQDAPTVNPASPTPAAVESSPSAPSSGSIDLKSVLTKLNEPIDLKALLFKKLL
jgi:hypothetical protein